MKCRPATAVRILAARWRRERRAGDHERGIASMLTVAMAALLLMVAVVAVGMGQVIASRHTAAAAADLGALAGAVETSCAAATRVVIANDAEPVDCTVTGSDVVVTAASRTHTLLGLSWTLRSTARAGPARR